MQRPEAVERLPVFFLAGILRQMDALHRFFTPCSFPKGAIL